MAALVCDLCGGKLIMGAGGIATCDSCGMEHSANRMKEKVQEIKGTVQVDNSHMIDNYLEMAETAKESGNNTEAEAYCNKILEIDPTNYSAWMLKGQAVAWQSTLLNSRVDEGVNAFIKGINNAPEDEREDLIEVAKEQITNLSVAMISLRADRFAKWPDEDESSGFISDLAGILGTVVTFLKETGALVPLSDIMAPVATHINQSVVKAYKNVILPDYKSERYPWPDDDDFRKYIERIGYCTTLVDKAISICDDDDEDDIQRYENLIFLHKEAINACSWDSEYADLSEQWRVNIYSKPGFYPIPRENRVYYKKRTLTDAAIASRKQLISQYESKIKAIKAAKAAKEAAEKAEKERIAREEAQKRFDAYWAEHAAEKSNYETELSNLNTQISALKKAMNDEVSVLNNEIAAIPGKQEIVNLEERISNWSKEKASLGLFKGKEKKALQEKIDQANSEKNSVQMRMDNAKKEIEAKISSVKSDYQSKITPLQNRANTISNELKKPR